VIARQLPCAYSADREEAMRKSRAVVKPEIEPATVFLDDSRGIYRQALPSPPPSAWVRFWRWARFQRLLQSGYTPLGAGLALLVSLVLIASAMLLAQLLANIDWPGGWLSTAIRWTLPGALVGFAARPLLRIGGRMKWWTW
jgi:hypothetical protein